MTLGVGRARRGGGIGGARGRHGGRFLSHTHTLSLSLFPSLYLSLSFSLTHSLFLSLSLSLAHTHTLSFSLSHTHAHTLSLSLSLSQYVSPSAERGEVEALEGRVAVIEAAFSLSHSHTLTHTVGRGRVRGEARSCRTC